MLDELKKIMFFIKVLDKIVFWVYYNSVINFT